MTLFLKDSTAEELVWRLGGDILSSKEMQRELDFIQHGNTTVYHHSMFTAMWCLRLAYFLHLRVDAKSLVRGALLHDYFLYDWHVKNEKSRGHAYKHAGKACLNAERDFNLNPIEQNMIRAHMFPCGYVVPCYRESIILVFSDKISAVSETVGAHRERRRIRKQF